MWSMAPRQAARASRRIAEAQCLSAPSFEMRSCQRSQMRGERVPPPSQSTYSFRPACRRPCPAPRPGLSPGPLSAGRGPRPRMMRMPLNRTVTDKGSTRFPGCFGAKYQHSPHEDRYRDGRTNFVRLRRASWQAHPLPRMTSPTTYSAEKTPLSPNPASDHNIADDSSRPAPAAAHSPSSRQIRPA